MAEDRVLTLLSPAGAKSEVFRWICSKKGEIRDENTEIIDVIHFVYEDVKELQSYQGLTEALKSIDRGSYNAVLNLCNLYNNAISQLLEEWSKSDVKPSFLNNKASKSHVQFILLQCYNRAVAEPDKLNQYPPFSPQVYGETSFELISQMIETVQITSDDSFIDLGSGVGQVVLQVAACSDAKFCYGIEKAEYPALCASNLDTEFRRWMSFYGKSYRPYLLERGDFLSPECHDRISSAGVLFANNFAFGPEVDYQLKQRFANLKEGARIISSKAFCPLNFRITDRNLSDIGSIMHVSCLNPIQDAVSWTDKPFSYYVHTIDRSLLERYFSRLKNPKLRDESELVRRDRKGRIISEQALKDGFHTNGTDKSPKESTDNESGVRNRRSHSLGSSVQNGQTRRSPSTASSNTANIQQSRPKGNSSDTGAPHACASSSRHHSTAATRRRRRRQARGESELTYALRTKLNSSGAVTEKSKPRRPQRLHRTIVDSRLASLSLNSDSGLLLSSASESNIESCPTGSSGHTTPSGSTSLSSVGCAPDEVQSEAVHGPDSDKPPGFTQYSSPDDGHPSHPSTRRNRPVGWNSASSSSSSSSFLSSSLPSTLGRSPPLIISDRVSVATGSAAATSCSINVVAAKQSLTPTDSDDSSRKSTDQPPIRITLTLSTKKPAKSDTDQSEADKTLTAEPELKPEVGDTSVARRRAIRKCRQLPQPSHPFTQSSKKFRILNSKRPGRGRPATLCCARRRSARGRPPLVHPKRAPPSVSGLGDEVRNVDVLHKETVTQIRATKSGPNQPYGLNDPAMASFTCHYQPAELPSLQSAKLHGLRTASDVNIGHSEEAVPFALTQFLELTKRTFMDHLSSFRSPAYANLVRQQLAVERTRQAELLARTQTLEDNIKRLHADGCDLLRNFTKRLGILISTPSAFFAQARKLIKHHHTLEDKIAEFRNEISQLSNANQELVRRHQVEAARLLSSALHTTQPTVAHHTHSKHEQQQQLSVAERPLIITSTSSSVASPPVTTTATLNPVTSNPPCLTHMAQLPGSDSTRTHSSKSRSGHRVRRSLPRLSPQSATPSFCSTTGVSHFGSPSQAPILFRSPEEPVRFSSSQAIPPPPPLLPMHNPHLAPFSHSETSILPCASSSLTCMTNPTELNAQTPLLAPGRSKSMHASLQDLIIDEFSRPKLSCIAPPLVNPVMARKSVLPSVTAPSSFAHVHSLPPRKRAWSATDPDHSSSKLARVQPPFPNGFATRTFPSSPPALSPVSVISPDDGDLVGSGTIATMHSTRLNEDPASSHGIPSNPSTSRGMPPPLLCATEYPSVSSFSSTPILLPSLPLMASSAVHP